MGKAVFAFLIASLSLFIVSAGISSVYAKTYTVTTAPDIDCSDNICDFQSALTEAQGNGAADVLNLEAGVFDASGGTFSYIVSSNGENFSLTINGSGIGVTTIDANYTLRGLLIDTTAGGVTAPPPDIDADIFINDLSFTRNSESFGAGGGALIRTNDADVNISNCEFDDNHASHPRGGSANGGGVSIITIDGDVSVQNSAFTNNTADFAANQYGGGLYILGNGSASDALITGNTFTGNSSGAAGGGLNIVGLSSGNATVNDNTFTRNHTNAGNDPASGGGALVGTGGTTIISNNVFYQNTSDNHGGGLSTGDPDLGANVYVINNTFFDNESFNSGAGLYLFMEEESGSAEISNNILWGNFQAAKLPVEDDLFMDDDLDVDGLGATILIQNNDITAFDSSCLQQTPSCVDDITTANNIDEDPLFNNVAAEDFHLTVNSPCINQALGTATNLPTTDFDGDNRIVGAAPDMGADEFTEVLISVAPTAIDFGELDIDATAEAREVGIANIGTLDLILSGLSLSDQSNYTVDTSGGSNPCGSDTATITAGDSCTVEVLFGPTSEGTHAGSLTINSNATNDSSVTVSLTGDGISSGGDPTGGSDTGGGETGNGGTGNDGTSAGDNEDGNGTGGAIGNRLAGGACSLGATGTSHHGMTLLGIAFLLLITVRSAKKLSVSPKK